MNEEKLQNWGSLKGIVVEEWFDHDVQDVNRLETLTRSLIAAFKVAMKIPDKELALIDQSAFRQHVKDEAWRRRLRGITHIGCSITRNYGTISVTFSSELFIGEMKAQERRVAYGYLTKELNNQHEHFAQTELPKTPANEPTQQTNNAPTSDIDVFDCERLSVKVDNGKFQYRLHGGRWMQFGAPIYNEVLERAGFVIADIPLTGIDLKGWSAKAQLSGGKVKRVLELTK